MNKYLKESLLWLMMLLPMVYLANVWNVLPEQVPTHFGFDGKANDWSSKKSLIYLIPGLQFSIYLLMLLIPAIDPKKKIEQMGDKYFNFRLILTIFLSLLSTYIVYASKVGNIKNPNLLFALIGVMFAMLGNYFQTLRPNYFIGIRTPWTLENENVWKSTHRLGGKIWMIGGIIIAILSFNITDNQMFSIIFSTTLFILAVIPIFYSYWAFKNDKKI